MELIVMNRGYGKLAKIARIDDYVHVFGDKRVEGYQKHILVVFDSGLDVVERRVLSKNTRRNAHFIWGKPAFDESTLYVAGWDKTRNEGRIIAYAIQIASPNL